MSILRNKILTVIAVAFLTGLSVTAFCAEGEVQSQTMTMEIEGDMFMLPELGAIIIDTESGPKVEMVLPGPQREKEYRKVDMQRGDIISMFNGKSVKSVADIQKTYEGLSEGDDVKFGVRHEKARRLLKFPKGDGSGPAQMQIMTIEDDGSGGAPQQQQQGGMMIQRIQTDDSNPGATALLDLGVLLSAEDGKVFIADLLPLGKGLMKGYKPAEGDVILELQGKEITSGNQVADIYGAVETGETVDLVVMRGEELIKVAFPKPQTMVKTAKKAH